MKKMTVYETISQVEGLCAEEREVLRDAFEDDFSDEQIDLILKGDGWMEMQDIYIGFKLGIEIDEMKDLLAEPDWRIKLKKMDEAIRKRLDAALIGLRETAFAVCKGYKADHPVDPQKLPALYSMFADKYREVGGFSGMNPSGCLNKNELPQDSEKQLKKLINEGIVVRRNCGAEAYELSLIERAYLICTEDLETVWRKNGGEDFEINNGYYGELHRTLREVIEFGKKEKYLLPVGIALMEGEDTTWRSTFTETDSREGLIRITDEGKYPVEVYYRRTDINGSSCLDSIVCQNRADLAETLDWIGNCRFTLAHLWDFNAATSKNRELRALFDKMFAKRAEIAQEFLADLS